MLYNEYAICVVVFSSISVIFGYCFLHLSVFRDASLRNYLNFNKYLGYAYFVLAVLNILELALRNKNFDAPIITFIVLFTASLQASLITYALITLINTDFNEKHPVFRELVPVIFFLLMCIISIVFNFSYSTRNIINIFFGGYYLFQLCHYTIMFTSEIRLFKIKTDNFYSDLKIEKIRWISISYYIALLIAISVPATLFYKSPMLLIISVVICILFYTFFGIKYLNYVYVFQLVRPALDEGKKVMPPHKDEIADKVDKWVKDKGYLISKININNVASELHTNRTYLSKYINSTKGMNFNSWVNFLRVEEAKSLLSTRPDFSLTEISEKVGYGDQSYFGRQFLKFAGTTPLSWRQSHSDKKTKNTQ